MPRCFIAFPAAAEAKKEIKRVQEEIKRHDLKAPIKFSASDDVHITVEFLGDLDKEKIREVESILARVCVNYSALEFALEHFDAYPDFTNPKVLVVGIKDETGLGLALQSEIHDELDKLGLIINHNRSWQPHLTVARVKAEWDRAGHYRKLPIEQISWRVDKVILFESKLEPDGPVYFILSEYQLK